MTACVISIRLISRLYGLQGQLSTVFRFSRELADTTTARDQQCTRALAVT